MQTGKCALTFALEELPQQSTAPDVVVMNMGIWISSTASSDDELRQGYEAVLQHGNDCVSRVPGEATSLA